MNGDWEMTINASTQYGYPYGALSRVLLCWIIGQSIKNYQFAKADGSNQVEVNQRAKYINHGDMYSFLDQLGIGSKSGGERGNLTIVRQHFLALINANIHFYNTKGKNERDQFENLRIGHKGNLLWSKKKIEEDEENAYLRITQEIYEVIASSIHPPIPIDLRAIGALRNSPLAIDLYVWLTYKMYQLSKQNKTDQTIPWSALMPQFGEGYSKQKEFTRNAKKALEKILLLYPEVEHHYKRGRIVLHQSPSHIPIYDIDHWWDD